MCTSKNIGQLSDYALMTANTGVITISESNPNLNGTGAMVAVITAGENGTIVKSIIVKSLQSNNIGMVRFFIGKNNPLNEINLVKEIPIPEYPSTSYTPTPTPIWPMLEIDLINPFKLKPGYILYASTQNSESFTIIAEGLDWKYPETLPNNCCDFTQLTENTGLGKVSLANPNLNGTGSIIPIYIAGNTNGSIVKSITIAALQSTHNGMVRLFLSPDGGSNYYLMMEILVPQTIQSSFQPSFKSLLKEDFYLQTGYIIGVSTQLSESFAITIEGADWEYSI